MEIMKLIKIFMVCAVCALFPLTSSAQEPKMLKAEEPVVLKARQVLPFEIIPGTIISLVILSADEFLPVAQVSMDVHDFYGNVAIPRWSRLIGKYVENRNGRHIIQWTGLQIPASAGTLKFDSPLSASMRDGSPGLKDFAPGSLASAITNESFLVPH